MRRIGEAAAQRRAHQRAQDGVDVGAARTGFFRPPQLGEPLAVGGEAAADEQFGDQLVLGAEMIVHRGEIDVRRRHDVAQRDVAKAAIGIEPFGGVEDRGPGLVRRHLMGPMQRGRCYSNSCMKLWFEGWKVNAHDVLPLQCMSHRPHSSPSRPHDSGQD